MVKDRKKIGRPLRTQLAYKISAFLDYNFQRLCLLRNFVRKTKCNRGLISFWVMIGRKWIDSTPVGTIVPSSLKFLAIISGPEWNRRKCHSLASQEIGSKLLALFWLHPSVIFLIKVASVVLDIIDLFMASYRNLFNPFGIMWVIIQKL